jgi:uncharacterized protein (DUF433 family)
MNDLDLLERITVNPKVMLGKPIVKETRLTVEFILERLGHGATVPDLLHEYPGLAKEDIQACQLFASQSLANVTFTPRQLGSGPDLQTLLSLFPSSDYFNKCEFVSSALVPEPYHHLLVHEHHMTVTVEAHHGSLVDVRILETKQDETSYARKILLVLRNTGEIVQFGIMRVRLEFCSPHVREAIVAGKIPLGRILINNGVLRRIEPTAFLRIVPGPNLMSWFGLSQPSPTFGRLAYIHCDGQPAIELLEIVAPEHTPA